MVPQPINQYGVVSIDMLKGFVPGKGNRPENAESIESTNGDQLVSFFDSEKIIKRGLSDGTTDNGLVQDWMKSVRNFSSSYLSDVSEEEKEICLSKINSRIARSTLLRTFLGDCDFTARNSGYIYNANQKRLDYAPNFDYGEAFTALRVAKLEGLHYSKNDLKFILEHQPNYLDSKKYEKSKSIKKIAQTYESDTSEENLRFICTHFEDDIIEFMTSLNQAVEDNVISDIIFSYAQKNEYGDQLITIEEAKMFDEYLTERANWITFVIIKNIMEAETNKFLEKIVKEKIGKHASSFSLEKLEGFVGKRFDSLPDEEKKKIENYPDHLQRADFIKENFPEEFISYTNHMNNVIDSLNPLSQNFLEYFHMEKETAVLSKDEVKGMFIRQFIDKTFETAYKTAKAPLPAQKTSDKGKV